MTTEVIELIRVDFDNMENHDPLEETSLGLFTERDNLSAHGSIKEFIKNYQPVNIYLGWDGEFYPKLKMIKKVLR